MIEKANKKTRIHETNFALAIELLCTRIKAGNPASGSKGRAPAKLRAKKILFTRTALRAPARVQSATAQATNVHRARKPAGDDRAQPEYRDQHQQVQEHIFQAL